MLEFGFPQEAQVALNEAYANVFSVAEYSQDYKKILDAYAADKTQGVAETIAFCKQVSKETGLNEYTMYALTLVMMAKISKIHYQKEALPVSVWKDNFMDLNYKLQECKLVKGVWGIFVPEWFSRFFCVDRFSFGRLQFERVDFGYTYNKNSVSLTKDSSVINIHIPRTGTGLTPQSVDEACGQAARFFKERYAIDPSVFVCYSWLLYPENLKVLKPTSNLYSFISRFDILSAETYQDYTETWRLFDCEYTDDLSKLPADTSFRRAYIDWIKKGQKTGYAYGVFIYEPRE